MQVRVNKIKAFKGNIEVPSDKSLSHRTVMLGSLCGGKVSIKNFSNGEDCQNTLKIFQELGAEVTFSDSKNFILNCKSLTQPTKTLYVGNSGTTIRLLSGLLAGQNFSSRLEGDISLSKRPMKRIIDPLSQMGANIISLNNDIV